MTLHFESAVGSHVGLVRSNNQDSGFAGDRLFFVADGMGGHAGGDVASALVTHRMAELDAELQDSESEVAHENPDDITRVLCKRLEAANKGLIQAVRERKELAGLGTTFVGFAVVEEKLAVAHIGDSRLYRFRGRRIKQMTRDHTFVQKLVDAGRITEEEAKTHPRRSVLMRVLGDVDAHPEFDTDVFTPKAGDIWLLCSDGLCGYVEDRLIERELRQDRPLQQTVDALIDRALEAGAPDNVTVTLVRPVEAEVAPAGPRFVGSAASDDPDQILKERQRRVRVRRRRKKKAVAETQFEPQVTKYLEELWKETQRANRRRQLIWLSWSAGGALLLAIVLGLGYMWTQTRYYVGTDGNEVVIYQGIQQNVGPITLHHEEERTGIAFDDLRGYARLQVERTISADSLETAKEIVSRLGVNEE